MVTGSLTVNFEPDIVLIYSNTAQLREMISVVKFQEHNLVKSEFDPIDPYDYSIVPVIMGGQYRINLPDHGKYAHSDDQS